MNGYSIINKKPSIVCLNQRLITKLGANYYSIRKIEMVEKIINSTEDNKALGSLVKTKEKRMKPKGKDSIYIGLANINSDTGEIEVNTVDEANIEGTSVIIEAGDILFSKLRPNLNKVAICPKYIGNALGSTEFVVMESKNIDKYFLYSVLKSNVALKQVIDITTGSTLPRIDSEDVLNILVPIPSPEIQKYIGDKVRRAEELREEAKRLKEEAELVLKEQLLLDKTESLYNNNAGNPSLEFNKYPIKIFVNPSDITTRLDAKSYHPEFYETLNYLQNNNFRTKVLKDMLEDYGTGISSPRYADSGTKILMTKNLKNDTIDLDCKRVDAKIDPKMRVNVEDVLVTTYGGPSIGKVDIFTSNEECVFDYTILKMRFTKDYNPYFMTLLLRSKLIQNQMRNLIKGTTGITFIIPTEILDIQIPIIEKSIQDEIGMLYQHSLKCIEIGKQLIQQAKQDVEDLIEGKFDMSKLNNDSSTESRC